MVWVLVFGAIALLALVGLVCWLVWLAHKTADVLAEVQVLGERAGQLAELVGEVRVPERRAVTSLRGGAGPGQADVR